LSPAEEASPERETAEAEVPAVEEEEAPAGPSRRRRRRRKSGVESEGAVEPDSSPMVERPIDDEPPIAAVEPTEEPKPTNRRRKKASAAEPEPESVPTESAPVEVVSEITKEAPPPKTARGRKRKAQSTPADMTAPEPAAAPAANNDTAAATDEGGEPRRGWWQRTFG
jgi:ribonuclease E